jgi:polar amino acid transport system substrate-binding protein
MRHRPRQLLVLLLLLWAPCHAIGLASVAWGDEPYRISADDGAPMFGDVSQMLRAAYRRLGLEIEIVTRPGRRSVTEANEGLFDGELVRAPVIEQHFHHLIRVPTQVATIDIVALVGRTRSGSPAAPI